MKKWTMALLAILALGLFSSPSDAQSSNKKPKSEVTKLRKARKKDHTTRQTTVDPKKSPGKHADNLSKNVNHEMNRESKDINRVFQGKKKKKHSG